jgi:tetratricopeptide (TPR) repeat protein
VPVQNAVVKFYRTDIKQTFEAKTGKNGTYVHAGIPLVGTFTIAVSAPGARPSYIPDIPIGRKSENNFVLEPGDGSALTLEQIKAAPASGGAARPAAGATSGGSAPKLSEEDKKRAEAEAAERKRIEEQNAKAVELNTKLPEILKSGNDAFSAKNYDQAITLYDQGLALDPTQAVFHRNRAMAFRTRGVDKFNTAAKAKDVPGKDAAKQDLKASAEGMEKALTAFRQNTTKSAGAAAAGGAGGQQSEELGYLFDRAESYRVALQTGAQVDTNAAIKAFEEYLAVETDPTKKMKGQNGLGDALFFGGKIDESIATFRQVIATSPQNLDAMTGLATALAAKGSLIEGGGGTAMISEARDLFQDFIKKAPDTHPKKADAIATAQYLDETLKAASAPKPSAGGGRNTGGGRKRP